MLPVAHISIDLLQNLEVVVLRYVLDEATAELVKLCVGKVV